MLVLLTLGFVACQQGETKVEVAPSAQMAFDITTTRVADGAFEAEDCVGLYVVDYLDAVTAAPLQISGNRANNEVMAYDGALWATERAIYWGETKADVYAYYPYMEIEDVDKQPFAVATDQSVEGAYEASDLLWAKAEGVAQADGAVALQMQHSMSRLVVKIMAGEEYIGSLPADATVHLHSTVTDACLSLANGSVVKDPYGGSHSIKMRNLGIRTFAEGEAVVYEAIVVPQMLETSVPLLEINSKSVSYLLEDMFNFKPGVSYTYTAVLNASTTSIKVDIGCEVEDWNNMGGSGEGGSGSEGDEEDGVDLSLYTDLSAEGTANCYPVKEAGNYKFKAVQGNSDATVGNVKKTEVLWETFGTDVKPNVGDIVATVGYKSGYVYFSTPETFKNGNASIAVRNSKDLILWSWHIWCSEEGWNDDVYPNNAGTMMDRNLGATSATPGDVGAFGLMYQWGRKDPFLGSSAADADVLAVSTGSWNISDVTSGMTAEDFVEENPTTIIDFTWKKGKWSTMQLEKGLYDPCPAGYRVPDGDGNGIWELGLNSSSWDSTNKGYYWTLADGKSTAWYPAVGYRIYYSDGGMRNVGTSGYYWSAHTSTSYYTDHSYGTEYSNQMYFTSIGINSVIGGYNRNCCSVRCIKDIATVSGSEPDLSLNYSNLSAEGTANCYLVKEAGNYKFKAVEGNSDVTISEVAKVRVLWESFGTEVMPNIGDLIKSVSYKDGYIYFSTPQTFKNGNASIAACGADGKILWSWHIWLSKEGWKDEVYPNNAGTMMDRNLGATSATPGSVGALGLMYQWGRKDPFMGSSSLTDETIAVSTGSWRMPTRLSGTEGKTANPMMWNIDYTNNIKEWSSSYTKGLYDPCPVGYRVPDGGENGFWATALGTSSTTKVGTTWDSTNMGRHWTLADGETTAWYPAVGYCDNNSGALCSVGSSGYYWSAFQNTNDNYHYTASNFYITGSYLYPAYANWTSYGSAVRCVKE